MSLPSACLLYFYSLCPFGNVPRIKAAYLFWLYIRETERHQIRILCKCPLLRYKSCTRNLSDECSALIPIQRCNKSWEYLQSTCTFSGCPKCKKYSTALKNLAFEYKCIQTERCTAMPLIKYLGDWKTKETNRKRSTGFWTIKLLLKIQMFGK